MLNNKKLSFKLIFYRFKNVNENQINLIKENFKKYNAIIKRINYYKLIDQIIFIVIFKKFQDFVLLKDNINFYKENQISNLKFYIINFSEEDSSKSEMIINKISLDQNQNLKYNNFKSDLLKNVIKSMKESELLNQCLKKILNKEKVKNVQNSKNINTKFLVIKNAFKLNLDINQIINLLTVFGNISKIFKNYLNGFIYIQFNKKKDVDQIIKYKNDLFINQKLIKIDYFYYSKVRKNPFEKYLIKMVKFNFNSNRYINNLKIKFNPPNDKIIISNIDSKVKVNFIFRLISKFSSPSMVKILENKNRNTNMCIVWFKSVEESIKVMMNLHNYVLNKYKLRVSFSFYNFK